MAAKYKKYSDGLCKTTISTKKYDENGKLIVKALSAKNSTQLEEKVGELKTKLKLGIYADDKKLTFAEYADRWYHVYPEKLTENATAKKYKGILNNHTTGIDDMKLSEITKSDIQELINIQEGHPDTQRMIKITVNQILEAAIDDGLLYKNVCSKIKVKAAEPSNKKRALTDQEKKVISIIKSEHGFSDTEQLYIDTLYVSGLRPEEALALTFTDVSRCSIDVNKSLSWKGGKHIKPPKSKAGYRKIDVPEWYQEEVLLYRKSHHTIYIFTGANGELISQSTYKALWNGIYNKINVKLGGTPKVIKQNKVVNPGIAATDLTPYIFRHNYCTMLYYLKIDLKEAARIMGHSNIKITLEIYTHLDSLKSSTQDKIAQISI